MTKRVYVKALFISSLGIIIPVISNIFSYSKYSTLEIIAANLFFICSFFLIGLGNSRIYSKLKDVYWSGSKTFSNISIVWLITVLYSIAASGILSMIWLKVSKENFERTIVINFMVLCVLSITLFNLISEIFLPAQKMEFENKKEAQPAHEGSLTEIPLLRNELDPHFMFNSLNTLSHLIINEAPKAHIFNSKLSSVYKYFLLNRDRELILLSHELEFIENYFYLLQIRYDNKLEMKIESIAAEEKTMILPCALQILIENAVKHNEYSEKEPLKIKIIINSHSLQVTNNIKPKPYLINASRIGLNNLNSRYRLVCNKDIEIENSVEQFTVRLPLIKN